MSEAVVPVPAAFEARIGPAELAGLHDAFATGPIQLVRPA